MLYETKKKGYNTFICILILMILGTVSNLILVKNNLSLVTKFNIHNLIANIGGLTIFSHPLCCAL